MNSKSVALLTNPHPCSHIVYPYTDENLVSQAVGFFASAGLRRREGVILIMLASHAQSIRRRLEAEGFNISNLEKTGQLVCMLAEDLLTRFMCDGTPDPIRFRNTIGPAIDGVRTSLSNGHRPEVRIFGEMVSLLWEADLSATIDLEDLWNGVVDAYGVSLLCTYDLQGARPGSLPQCLINAHSHDIPAQQAEQFTE